MKNSFGRVAALSVVLVLPAFSLAGQAGPSVGKWKRHVISLSNTSVSGNPFELEVDGTFTHSASGTQLTLPGYYDGSNTWKIGFMPTKTGTWTWTTSSTDSDLDNRTGSLTCVSSGHPGMLKRDSANSRKWKYTDGPYVVPIILRGRISNASGSLSDFTVAADFIKNTVKGQMMDWPIFHDPNLPFSGGWQNHQFNLTFWSRLEQRMEVMTDRGLGYQAMFYTDDALKPPWSAQSNTEKLVFRYSVARLCGFPGMWFNTGIDIREYRNGAWVDWFAQEIQRLDPYDHPVSSRYGGGSGSEVANTQTWDSRGDQLAKINDMTNYFNSSSVPVSMDDAWGENRPSRPQKDFRPEDIRRAFWKCIAAGGVGGMTRGSNDPFDSNFGWTGFAQELESEQWLQHVNPYLQFKLGTTFGTMVPASSLVTNGYALADPGRTRIFYFLLGKNDKWDSGNGGDITLRLSGVSGSFTAAWFNPRNGSETGAGTLAGGQDRTLTPPSTDDWALTLTRTSSSNTPPTVSVTSPTGGATFTAPANITVQATASDADGTVTQVEFFAGGSSIGTDTSSPYSVSWTNVVAGSYSLTAVATDNGGAGTTSSAVNITVSSPSNQLPSVTLTSPSGGAQFTAPADVTFQATASDPDGNVVRVDFLADGSVVGGDTTGPYAFTWSGVAAGTYVLEARATDDAGGSTTSSSVTITVNPAGSPPTAPSNLTATVASSTRIDLSWQDNSGDETGFVIERLTGVTALSVTLSAYNGANTSPTVEAAGTADSFQVGARVVNDRSDTWTSVPALLSGATRLLTARNDRQQLPVDSKYVVALSGPATIFLPLDPRYGGAKTSWMDASWTDSGQTCDSSVLWGWTIWTKTVSSAGNVTLGCDDAVRDGICYAFAGGGSWSVIATVGSNVTRTADTNLSAGTTYSYRVRATNQYGDSLNSNIATATTGSSGPDADGDGLPDSWETTHFGNITSQDGAGDPDGDALSNLQEYNAGTDPNQSDTDGDGLTDAQEVLTYATNPTVPDSDGDGMRDGDEVAYGLDPLNGDQDGDSVPDGRNDWNGNGTDNQTDIAGGVNPGMPPGPAPAGGGGGSGGGCGATGFEAVLLLGLLGLRRRGR